MLKDHFQKSINTLNTLRSEHFKISQYLSKGKYRLKQKFFGKGKKHYDFDINSQEFFHQYLDDIIFEQTEIQEIFYTRLSKFFQQHPIQFAYSIPKNISYKMEPRKNPSEVRVLLGRFFKNRANDLSYKKYLTMLRLHNHAEEQHFIVAKSRTNLIDKEIQQSLNRQSRLQTEDYFEMSYTQGGKPVPVNENGQPIYKYLDEEQCWFSNINRQDILVYSRNFLYKQQILEEAYWPYYYAIKNLVFKEGIEICDLAEKQLIENCLKNKEIAIESSKNLIAILEKDLQDISPGNLQEKQNLNNFVYTINGVVNDRPSIIPKYPAIFIEMIERYSHAIKPFFKSLTTSSHKQIISLIPKINSFCSILFKYQNQQVLEGQKQIKLGLDDDVDIRKQLITMLEELWVRNYVAIDYKRFDYKIYIKPIDWQLDTYAKKLQKDVRHVNDNGYKNDSSLEQLLRLVRMNSYSQFRKIIKKRSQKIVQRLPEKYIDMEGIQNYCEKSDEEINTERLQDLFRMKVSYAGEIFKNTILKDNATKFLSIIIKNYLITNPVEIQIAETLTCIKIRQTRTKIMNSLNAIRCYHRNIDIDMRVTNGCQFKFQLDDNLLINSNKQLIQKFQKGMKDNETVFSKSQPPSFPTLESQDFLMHNNLDKTMMYKKDIVKRQFFGGNIPHLLVSDGRKRKNNIIYNIVLEDLKLVQERILQNGTHFINRYQRLIKIRSLPELADRVCILEQLFDLELQFIYEKFNLIEKYYYIYQNTSQPLHAHKIAKIIIQLTYMQPKIDLTADYFTQSYRLVIDQLKQENKIITTFTNIMETKEKQKNRNFHNKFAKMQNIPLTLWAYIYGDLFGKQKSPSKLQRMNSVTSKMSKNSKEDKNLLMSLRNQIKEQLEGDDSDYEEDEFKIEEYDQYMLKRNMDDIFEDIVENKNGGGEKQKDTGVGNVSSLGIENFIVNPRFQGGPHPQLNYLPDVNITSTDQQKLMNFSENLYWVSNIHHLLKDLRDQHEEKYGFCSQEYSNQIYYQISKKVNQILLSPCQVPQKFFQFSTDDPYFEVVSKGIKHFEETMIPILDLPTSLQLQLPSTHERHQMLLPNYSLIQQFDINLLKNLIKLQKPINFACYRELNLGVNFIEFLRLRQQVFHFQLERDQIMLAYEIAGKNTQTSIEKYAHCYTRSGQSQIFMAASEIKNFASNFTSYPIYNDSIEQLRILCNLQLADIALFRGTVAQLKRQTEDYMRAAKDIENDNMNSLLDRKQFLLSFDKKNVKMIKNRAVGYLATLGSENLKGRSFNKMKLKLKSLFEEQMKAIKEQDFEPLIIKHYFDGNEKKYNQICKNILTEKLKKMMINQLMKKYTQDLIQNLANIECVGETCDILHKLRNYIDSLPYLRKIFVMPTQFQNFNKKIFYDQKKVKIVDQMNEDFPKITYVQSKQQFIQHWQEFSLNNHRTNNITQKIDCQNFIISTLPPQSKDDLFKWMFKIPANNLQDNGKQAMRHFFKIGTCYSGKICHSEYRCDAAEEPSRNKFLEAKKKYQTILQYIQSNINLISLQVQDDIFDSLHYLIRSHCNFQKRYPLVDQGSIYQTDSANDERILAPCFIYENKKDDLQKQLKVKINSRGYMQKKMHWNVVDEILDFIISKVQGYGVLRHSMLELKDQIEALHKIPSEIGLKYMKEKTQNSYKILWLAIWDTYRSKNDPQFNDRIQEISECLVNVPAAEICQTPLTSNQRRGISKGIPINIDQIQQEKLKFSLGTSEVSNKFLINQCKPIFCSMAGNLETFIQNQIYSFENGENQVVSRVLTYNRKFVGNFRRIFKTLGRDSRFRYFGNCRCLYEDAKKYIDAKVQPTDLKKLYQSEELKSTYLSYLVQSKTQLIALTELKISNQSLVKNWENFSKLWEHSREIIDYNTFSVYDQLQSYKQAGKIQFSKTQLSLVSQTGKESKPNQQVNKVIRQIIFCKLAKEQFKSQILNIAIRCLKAQKIPKPEPKKIMNQSLIPRVHLIASYSSPLIVERKTYISQQYKLAFVQAFINRFRNKVSRVDLLSSGYGFVITVPDLEDCVNFMNKLLFTFTEKQFTHRLDTFSQYYQILIEAVRNRNKTISQQKAIIKMLQEKVNNTLQAQYLAKVSKLVHEKVLIEQKLRLTEQSSNGLEFRVRKTIQHQYEQKMSNIQNQNKELRKKFNQFKDLLIKLTKDTTKNNFLAVLNQFRDQVSSTLNKKVDLSDSLQEIAQLSIKIKASPQKIEYEDHEEREMMKKLQYGQEDIQKCKIGQDIIHDPYYTTKLINKMRLFNIFKMGCKRIKFEEKQNMKDDQLTELHQIQDKVVAQTQRQTILRQELIKAQEELSKRAIQLDKAKQMNESLENEKAKLKILINSKDRKMEQRERQIQELKKKSEEAPKVDSMKNSQLDPSIEKNIEELPKLSSVRKQKRVSQQKIVSKSFLTGIDYDKSGGTMSLYEKFELSNKDSTWREKCQQLYMENKKLLSELERYKEMHIGVSTPVREGNSLNLRNKRTSDQSERESSRSDKRKFPNLSFKYSVMKQG